MIFKVSPAGFEPATFGFGGPRSIDFDLQSLRRKPFETGDLWHALHLTASRTQSTFYILWQGIPSLAYRDAYHKRAGDDPNLCRNLLPVISDLAGQGGSLRRLKEGIESVGLSNRFQPLLISAFDSAHWQRNGQSLVIGHSGRSSFSCGRTGELPLWLRGSTSSTAGSVACHVQTAIFIYSLGGARWAL
jgi:hypothetical protein